MNQLEKFKNMSPEEAQAYLDAFEAEGGCSGNCSACQSECNSKVDKPAKNVIAVLSGKGGTGNSTITAMLACAFAREGLKVGILDADISSSAIGPMFGIAENMAAENGKFIPQHSSLGIEIVSLSLNGTAPEEPVIYPAADKTKLAVLFWLGSKWAEDLDVLLVDLPKAADDTTLEYFTTMPVDIMIPVSNPGKLSETMTRRVINLGHMLMLPILGIIENFSESGSPESFEERYGSETALLASIPYDSEIRTAAESGNIENIHSDEINFFAKAISEELK